MHGRRARAEEATAQEREEGVSWATEEGEKEEYERDGEGGGGAGYAMGQRKRARATEARDVVRKPSTRAF